MSYNNKVHQIFTQNIFLGVFSYDIMCNGDITDSPFLENMASLKRLLKLNKKSKWERMVNFSSPSLYYQQVKIFQIYWMSLCIYL